MNLPWIIELELPSGVFSTSQLAEPIPTEELDADVRASYDALRQIPSLLPQPLPSKDSADPGSLTAISPPQPVRLMVGHYHEEYVTTAIVEELKKRFSDPSPPWPKEMFSELKNIFVRFYANRASPNKE